MYSSAFCFFLSENGRTNEASKFSLAESICGKRVAARHRPGDLGGKKTVLFVDKMSRIPVGKNWGQVVHDVRIGRRINVFLSVHFYFQCSQAQGSSCRTWLEASARHARFIFGSRQLGPVHSGTLLHFGLQAVLVICVCTCISMRSHC